MQNARDQLRQCSIKQMLWYGGGEAFDDMVDQFLILEQLICRSLVVHCPQQRGERDV